MEFEMYNCIAKWLFESSKKEHVFVHLFLILNWNMMKRSKNCVNMKVAHIQLHEDALVFEFATSKGMQGSYYPVGPCHVYMNPLNPFICPLLALARYFLMFPETLNTNATVFQGMSQYNRYLRAFLRFVAEHKVELKKLRVQQGDIWTHSCRKGVGKMISQG